MANADIGAFTPEQARALWQDFLTRQQLNQSASQNMPQRREIVDTRRRVIGKLDAELSAGTFEDAPGTATLSLWRRNADGDYEDSTENITVVNRFENITIASGTIVKAEWIDGEWQVYAADCEAA